MKGVTLPLAYYSHRRRLGGVGLTLLELATSMFWFPRPKRVDPRVKKFLLSSRTIAPAVLGLLVCNSAIVVASHARARLAIKR